LFYLLLQVIILIKQVPERGAKRVKRGETSIVMVKKIVIYLLYFPIMAGATAQLGAGDGQLSDWRQAVGSTPVAHFFIGFGFVSYLCFFLGVHGGFLGIVYLRFSFQNSIRRK